MKEYFFTYHGGEKPKTPEEGQKHMQEWKEWAEGLGDKLVNPGSPIGITKILSASGVVDAPSPNPAYGFSVVKAESLEDALETLKECPHLTYGGTLEVSEIMMMGGK